MIYFRNPMLSRVGYGVFVVGMFAVVVLLAASINEYLIPAAITGVFSFIFLVIMVLNINKPVFIKHSQMFSLSRFPNTYHQCVSFSPSCKLGILHRSIYVPGGTHRTRYNIVLTCERDDYIYYLGFCKTRIQETQFKYYAISTELSFKHLVDAQEKLKELKMKGVPVHEAKLLTNYNLFTNSGIF